MPVVPPILAPHVSALAQFQRRVRADRWLVSTGRKAATDPAPFVRYAHLADGRLARRLIEAGHAAWAGELITYYFYARLREATDRLRRAERVITADFRGRPHAYAELLAARRAGVGEGEETALARALEAVASRVAAEQRRWIEEYGQARAGLGFASHRAFARALYPDLERWAVHAARWLDDTRGPFLGSWRRWRERDGLAEPLISSMQGIAGRVGVPAAVSAVRVARDTVADMGFDTGQIAVDSEVRPGKAAMAFCSPVAPPGDVRVSIHEARTMPALVAALHEFGHGAHFTAGPGAPADLWPVAPAVVEGVGLMTELAAWQADWQCRHLGTELPEPDVARLAFGRDCVRRVVAASIGYELSVLDGHADPETEYRRVFGRELGVRVPPYGAFSRLQQYLQGQPCYPLVYYQAFMIRDALWRRLVSAGGPSWYMSASARGYLSGHFKRMAEIDNATWMRDMGCVPGGSTRVLPDPADVSGVRSGGGRAVRRRPLVHVRGLARQGEERRCCHGRRNWPGGLTSTCSLVSCCAGTRLVTRMSGRCWCTPLRSTTPSLTAGTRAST